LSIEDEDKLEYALRGKAWKVYWLLLKNGRPMSVREVQKALHFSSPSVAQHHLEQLKEMGLVQKQDVGGHYYLVSEVKIGVLRHFVKFGQTTLSKVPVLRRFFHNLLHDLPHTFNAQLYTRKPIPHSLWSHRFGNILV
jgi:predicted transcriptional regulator